MQWTGTVTRNSNGSLEIRPTSDARGVDRIEIHADGVGVNSLPPMGAEVTLTLETVPSAASLNE